VLRYVALALATSAVSLLLRRGRTGPRRRPAHAGEATRKLDDDEKEKLKALLEGFLRRHNARRWTNAS